MVVRILCDESEKADRASRLLTEAIAIEESNTPREKVLGTQPERRLWRDFPDR
jgi:hypothetical protein